MTRVIWVQEKENRSLNFDRTLFFINSFTRYSHGLAIASAYSSLLLLGSTGKVILRFLPECADNFRLTGSGVFLKPDACGEKET